MSRSRPCVKLRVRICVAEDIAIGPGKADLLESIEAEGSITAASRCLGMSYKRAWNLVETMNRCFQAPLVETSKGGAARGGAALTSLGRAVLERYRAMEAAATAAAQKEASFIQARLVR